MPPSFLVISSEFPPGPGGIGRHAYCVCKALSECGYQVNVITEADYASSEEFKVFDELHKKDFKLIRNQRKGISTYLIRLKNTRQVFIKSKPSTVIVSGKFSLWLGGLLKLIWGKKVQVWAFLHGTELQLPQWWEKKLTGFSLNLADRLIAVSGFSKFLLSTSLQSRTEVIPNGLLLNDMPPFHGKDIVPFNWPGWPRLLTVGSLTPRKGQHRVIKALLHLKRVWPDIRYHMVGLPQQQEELFTLAQGLGVDDCIIFHGRLQNSEKLWQAYRSADVFVMLSENQENGDVEGFGIAILEANYFGLPAIGALGCGIEDAIENGKNGFLVDGNDANAIEQSLARLLAQSSEMAAAAKKHALSHNWTELIKRLVKP